MHDSGSVRGGEPTCDLRSKAQGPTLFERTFAGDDVAKGFALVFEGLAMLDGPGAVQRAVQGGVQGGPVVARGVGAEDDAGGRRAMGRGDELAAQGADELDESGVEFFVEGHFFVGAADSVEEGALGPVGGV